ncbi:MAG: YbaN family protein [Tissierellia bacterium]|nr:YbaN family protein [Tissierellia bacterium]
MSLKKILLMISGLLFVALAGLGAVLPVLPTVPFLLLAAICFAKSSERLHNWLISTNLYKKNLESYFERKGMTLKTKIKIMSIASLTMGISFFMMKGVLIGRIVLFIVWVIHIFYFVFKIRTLDEDDEISKEDIIDKP